MEDVLVSWSGGKDSCLALYELQSARHTRRRRGSNFAAEGSLQLPLIRNTGPQALRTDYNLLLGVKYLF